MSRVKDSLATAYSAFTFHRSARNVVWNLLGGVSLGVMTVLATPIYVSRLGLEGYGVVGLWLVMQVMIGLLDMGMGASVVRSFAAAPPGDEGGAYRRDLLRTLEVLYWLVAIAVVFALATAAGWTGSHWLKTTTLADVTLIHALQFMAVALGFQFASVLYTNGLAGLQAQGAMNALQTSGNVLRYGGGVLVLLWRADVALFFVAQAVIAGIQTLVLRSFLWRMLLKRKERPEFRLELVTQLWKYSLGMALSSAAAVLLANSDRIAIGSLLPAAELGKYSIAYTATGLLQLGIQPFYRAFFPRYSELVAAQDKEQLRAEYFRSSQLAACCIIPLLIAGWAFAPQLLTAWLGRNEPTVVSVFRWLLIGVSCSGLMWLPAALQQANGWTRLHAGMIAGALIVGAPLMVLAIRTVGTVGATVVWMIHGVSGVTLELWLMHRRLLRGELGRWYRTVVGIPLSLTLPVVGLSWLAMPNGLSRWLGLIWAGFTALVAVGLTLLNGFGRGRRVRPTASDPVIT